MMIHIKLKGYGRRGMAKVWQKLERIEHVMNVLRALRQRIPISSVHKRNNVHKLNYNA